MLVSGDFFPANHKREETPMSRKRITERFPFLIPLRTAQRRFCFYAAMRFDKNTYCKKTALPLPHLVSKSSAPLRNTETGFNMIYQENKIFNLKLAAKALNGLVIKPGETFSFCRAVKRADRKTPYRDGLVMMNGKLTPSYGGGMCQMSDLIFMLFLHSSLTVTERHGHKIKSFPDLGESNAPKGTDATVFEGWLDLKARNTGTQAFQLCFDFSEDTVTGYLLSDFPAAFDYEITNGRVFYEKKNGETYEHAEVIQRKLLKSTGEAQSEQLLYTNICKINYPITGEETENDETA